MSDGLHDPANQNAHADARPEQAAPEGVAFGGSSGPDTGIAKRKRRRSKRSRSRNCAKDNQTPALETGAESDSWREARARETKGREAKKSEANRGAARPGSRQRTVQIKNNASDKRKDKRAEQRTGQIADQRREKSEPALEQTSKYKAKQHLCRRQASAKPARQKTGQKVERYAALDLGTNNCRLLVAEPQDQGFRVVDAFSRIVRLGDGMAATGALGNEAMARAIGALKICSRKLGENRVKKARLVATEACRFAENGADFLANVEATTGLQLEIVDRETEARLAVSGCSSLVHPRARGVILFDIGGGSSELVWLDLRARQHERGVALNKFIRAWVSLPVGVVTLSEKFGGVDVTKTVFEAMVDHVSLLLNAAGAFAPLDDEFEADSFHLLGTSGTVTTLAGIHLNLRRYDRRQVDGLWMQSGDVTNMINVLIGMDYDARVDNPCIGSDRADLVLAGCAIFEAFRRRWPCLRIRVADRGLREGILIEMMSQDQVWRRRRGQRRWRQGRSTDHRAAAAAPQPSTSTPLS